MLQKKSGFNYMENHLAPISWYQFGGILGKKLVPSRPLDDILIPSIPWWSEFEAYVQELYVVVVCVLESTTADPS